MDEKFQIVHLRGRPVIMGTYDTDGKHARFYNARHVSDEIQVAAFEHIKNLAQTDGSYKIMLNDIENIPGHGIQSSEHVCGGRFNGFVGRKLDVEQRPNYGGPCYTACLEICTDNTSTAYFLFRASSSATPKIKHAEEVLTNLLLDVLQLNKKAK